MVTITSFGSPATPPAVQPEMAVYDQRMPAPMPMHDDCGCGGNDMAVAAYRRYEIIQVLTILFYILMVVVLVKMLMK